MVAVITNGAGAWYRYDGDGTDDVCCERDEGTTMDPRVPAGMKAGGSWRLEGVVLRCRKLGVYGYAGIMWEKFVSCNDLRIQSDTHPSPSLTANLRDQSHTSFCLAQGGIRTASGVFPSAM